MAKDTTDKKTEDLLKSPNARRQADFKRKMREAGFQQKQVWVHGETYQAGFEAGEFGSVTISDFPPGLEEDFKKSWCLGYVDGALKAKVWP